MTNDQTRSQTPMTIVDGAATQEAKMSGKKSENVIIFLPPSVTHCFLGIKSDNKGTIVLIKHNAPFPQKKRHRLSLSILTTLWLYEDGKPMIKKKACLESLTSQTSP